MLDSFCVGSWVRLGEHLARRPASTSEFKRNRVFPKPRPDGLLPWLLQDGSRRGRPKVGASPVLATSGRDSKHGRRRGRLPG